MTLPTQAHCCGDVPPIPEPCPRLSAAEVRARSLEHHLALVAMRDGRGNREGLICLLRAARLAFHLRDVTASGSETDPFRRAGAALGRCVARAERGERWLLLDREYKTLHLLLMLHDEQLAAVPMQRYMSAWKQFESTVEGITFPLEPG
ncbi:hypothetical protein [Burkholderia alba]|uniref:hypothetical protein n=1 Tax=Burkholderia alba TaxID=2683677 RepID=UPI002B05A35E|nr:hypothetical protein [Burkholderia alba]